MTMNEKITESVRNDLFEGCILPHKGLIYSYIRKLTYAQEWADDDYQNITINFHKRIHTYDTTRPVKSWIIKITIREIRHANRRRQNMKRNDDVNINEISNCYSNTMRTGPVDMGMDNYREVYSDDILIALEMLPEIYRETLLLRMAGHTIREIAEITYSSGSLKRKNMETVRSRLHLGRQKMKTLINHEGELIKSRRNRTFKL